MTRAPTFGRYAEIPESEMTQEQREGYRFLMDGPRGRLPGPYKIWIHNPKLVQAADPLGRHFTPGQYSLTEREREIAVVVITSALHSAYPNNAHEICGKEVGLPAGRWKRSLPVCRLRSTTRANNWFTKCPWRWRTDGLCRKGCTIALSPVSGMSASAT